MAQNAFENGGTGGSAEGVEGTSGFGPADAWSLHTPSTA